MKKIMIIAAALCAAIDINAQTGLTSDEDTVGSSWAGNWFAGVQGGASVYVGKPLGCGDVFDRISPDIHLYVGKWFTPAVGGRISYQGWSIKDCTLSSQSMQSYHADLMYNIMSYRYSRGYDQRFDLIPYAGCGLIHNSDIHRSDFSLNYGIQARYRLTDCLHLTAEASGLTTFQQFDGSGTADRLGDHKFDLSIGLAVTIGKVGFRNSRRSKVNAVVYDSHESSYDYKPMNDYSGLNTLRARLAYGGSNITDNHANTQADHSLSDECHCNSGAFCKCSDCRGKCAAGGHHGGRDTKNESSWQALVNGIDTLGLTIPYICHFKINSHDLTDNRQLDQLSKIVKLAKERGMSIRVTGAADSATGTADINQRLSEERANFISEQLMSLGMGADHIKQRAIGGVEEFSPASHNRYCKIQLIHLSSTL